jgi:hypothetical protein
MSRRMCKVILFFKKKIQIPIQILFQEEKPEIHPLKAWETQEKTHLTDATFFAVLGLELRASHLLGRHSIT